MNRLSALITLAVLCLGLSYLASCSDPLEITSSNPAGGPNLVETVYVFDTLTPSDTAVRADTVWITDTVNLTDTAIALDTVTQYDTVTVTDTHMVVDTLKITEIKTIVDTLTLTDTITQVDTVTIVQPGNCQPQPICGRISCKQKEVLWMFRNDAGAYHLEFSGSTENDNPLQTLLVNINGTTYTWVAGENPLWVTDLVLVANTKILVSLANPYAYGHEIDVCLSMTPK